MHGCDLKQHLPVEVDLVEGAMPDEKWTVWAKLIEHLVKLISNVNLQLFLGFKCESHTIHLYRRKVWVDQESVDVSF